MAERAYAMKYVAAVVFCTAALHAAPENRIVNSGFEEGTRGWKLAPGHRILSDPSQAHSGKACLFGEVSGPQQALIATQRVRVSANSRYELALFCRATNRTKLAVWAVYPEEKERRLVAAFRNVPARWRRFRVPLQVRTSGELELQLVAPSSYGAPPGRMSVDDVELLRSALPPCFRLSKEKGFNDEPTMTRGPDGSLYAAWISFRNGRDTLALLRFQLLERGLKTLGSWTVEGAPRTFLLSPRLVVADDGAFCLYAAEKEGNWDIYAVRISTAGFSSPLRITRHRAVDIKPAAVWTPKGLAVAWESNRTGTRQIFFRIVSDSTPAGPEKVSVGECSNYEPSVCALPGGSISCAWHSFRNNNYDIYYRKRGPSSQWGPERRLTASPGIDRHAVLFTRGSEEWILYENALTQGYRIGATVLRRTMVALLGPAGCMVPITSQSPSPLLERAEGATACFDRSGRLHVVFLRGRLPRAGWDVWRTVLGGNTWSAPTPVSPQKGMDRVPSLQLLGNKAVVCFQGDDLPQSWSDVDKTMSAQSHIFCSVYPVETSPASPMRFSALKEPADPFEAGALRIARGEDTPTPQVTYRGRTLKLFYGDLHEHTDVSVCNRLGDQSIDESYQHMRDIASLDFACTTDHGYNINPYLWAYTAKLARAHEDPGRFLTFLAEEWTSSFERYSAAHPYGYYGHRNLIFADPYFPRWWNARDGMTPAQVWEELRKMQADFVHIPHQLADTGNVPTDWNFTDPVAQPVAEIFQVRGSYEYKGAPREARRTTPRPGYFLQDAWARGIVIGVIASPDHGGGLGKACVYAPQLTRSEILKALRQRRCFGTTGARMAIDLRVNGHFMGEALSEPPPRAVTIAVSATCPQELDRVEICRNNRFIYTVKGEGKAARFTFVDTDPPAGRAYWYVRVLQKDGEIGWSSPVWYGVSLRP